jgi:hypothetical protein
MSWLTNHPTTLWWPCVEACSFPYQKLRDQETFRLFVLFISHDFLGQETVWSNSRAVVPLVIGQTIVKAADPRPPPSVWLSLELLRKSAGFRLESVSPASPHPRYCNGNRRQSRLFGPFYKWLPGWSRAITLHL